MTESEKKERRKYYNWRARQALRERDRSLRVSKDELFDRLGIVIPPTHEHRNIKISK
ncbi:hypothetical protein NAD41_000923 [Salmonella enterica]|nr:hypothetical protein [Salmonella enterica]EKK6596306.1 hypothetical protein [Salmonella enterica]